MRSTHHQNRIPAGLLFLSAMAMALALAACTITPRDGQYTCPAPEHACPEGMRCDLGVCRVGVAADAGTDGALTDTPRPDGSEPDVPGLDAGCADRDHDGQCAGTGPGEDCNDADDRIGPHQDETCTPLLVTAGTSAADENCNGEIDEGCAWSFGRPHPAIRAHVGEGAHYAASASGDGLRLYTVAANAGPGMPIMMVRRANLTEAFSPALPVGGTAIVGLAHALVAVTADELEIFSQTDADTGQRTITHFVRPNTMADFERVALPSLGAMLAFHPSVTADGLELFVTLPAGADRSVHRLVRARRDLPFGAPEQVLPPPSEFATISPDGHDLFFGSTVSHRTGRSGSFGVPTSISPIASATDVFTINYVPATRELWISASHPWSAAPGAIWRVQVCRDGPCLTEGNATCGSPSRTSPDGFHCYSQTTSEIPAFMRPFEGCGRTPTNYAATIHSTAELTLVRMLAMDGWLGGNSTATGAGWDNREPFVGAPWMGPSAGRVVLQGGLLEATTATSARPLLCETEVWPSW